jgi:hypothetical protein
MASVVRFKIAIRGAYTCLSFACAVLERQFRKIEDLNRALEHTLYYEGSLNSLAPDSGSREDRYFTQIGFMKGNWKSFLQDFSILKQGSRVWTAKYSAKADEKEVLKPRLKVWSICAHPRTLKLTQT